MKRIERYEDADANLAEIYSTGFQLSLVSPDDKQCHAWVLCKDFFNEAIWAQLHKKPVTIYNFKYDPAKQPEISMEPVKIIVRDKTKENDKFDASVGKAVKFLNMMEDAYGFEHSTVEKISFFKDANSVWLFTCPKEWVHAPPLISLLGLILRVGCYYNGENDVEEATKWLASNVKHNDAEYLTKSEKLRRLIGHKGLDVFKPAIIENYPEAPVHTIHHRWGIVNAPQQPQLKNIWDLADLDVVGPLAAKKKKKTTKKKKKVVKKKKKKVVKKKKVTKKKKKKVAKKVSTGSVM